MTRKTSLKHRAEEIAQAYGTDFGVAYRLAAEERGLIVELTNGRSVFDDSPVTHLLLGVSSIGQLNKSKHYRDLVGCFIFKRDDDLDTNTVRYSNVWPQDLEHDERTRAVASICAWLALSGE